MACNCGFSCDYSDCMSREMYDHTGCNCFASGSPNHGTVVEGRRLGRPRTAPTFILQSSSHPPPAGGGGDDGDNDGDGGNKLGG